MGWRPQVDRETYLCCGIVFSMTPCACRVQESRVCPSTRKHAVLYTNDGERNGFVGWLLHIYEETLSSSSENRVLAGCLRAVYTYLLCMELCKSMRLLSICVCAGMLYAICLRCDHIKPTLSRTSIIWIYNQWFCY